MKSFIKGIWSRTKSDSPLRSLDKPKDLMSGDMLQLSDSFGLPPRLRDQIFKVVGVSTYQFEHEYSTCFSLEGKNDDRIDLTIEGDSGRSEATFTLAIDRSLVEKIFDMDQFALIFDPDENAQINVNDTLDMAPWLAQEYYQEARAEAGYFYASDNREDGPSKYADDGEPFEFYLLKSTDQQHGVEIEVYASGETNVSLSLYRPIDDIKDLWPAEKE